MNNAQSLVGKHLRQRKHVPCFYRAIETRAEVRKNEKCCGNTVGAAGECFHNFFEFSQTFTSGSIKQFDYELSRANNLFVLVVNNQGAYFVRTVFQMLVKFASTVPE